MQGNIDQDQPWTQNYVDSTFTVYRQFIEQAAQTHTELVVWPETAFPGIFNYDQVFADLVSSWSARWRVAQLVGCDEIKNSPQSGIEYYNTMVLLSQEGGVQGRTAKLHLVPFGEV